MADIAVGRKIVIGIRFDTVHVEIICGDAYEAEVLYDDLVERAESGEAFSIGIDARRKVTQS